MFHSIYICCSEIINNTIVSLFLCNFLILYHDDDETSLKKNLEKIAILKTFAFFLKTITLFLSFVEFLDCVSYICASYLLHIIQFPALFIYTQFFSALWCEFSSHLLFFHVMWAVGRWRKAKKFSLNEKWEFLLYLWAISCGMSGLLNFPGFSRFLSLFIFSCYTKGDN